MKSSQLVSDSVKLGSDQFTKVNATQPLKSFQQKLLQGQTAYPGFFYLSLQAISQIIKSFAFLNTQPSSYSARMSFSNENRIVSLPAKNP